MLYTYPSNRLENLVDALDTLLQSLPRAPLAPDTVLVQHPGMQHWLSMELAKRSDQQICMNMQYPLPVRYFWDLIRMIIGPENVPERSVYSREILVWRLYALLEREDIAADPLMSEPTRYWQKQSQTLQSRRRFQLAEQQADLYEQYLMYRPDWIEHWEANPAEHWQALLWQHLIDQNPNHPLRLMKQAMKQVKASATELPPHFFLFGINTLAPLWLEFLSAIAEQTETDIHLLYLNPSAEHWDDLKTDKQRIKQLIQSTAQPRANWLGDDSEFWLHQADNPLLTSLGMQGQAFVKLLSQNAHYDAHVFSRPAARGLLGALQSDLLEATDGRISPKKIETTQTLQVTSAHSAFREVQGLHDWLLHQFNADASLTPKDVLIMCPNVEDYAPFVQAVFSRGFSDDAEDSPPLPCSIADRHLKDADPTVAAFLDLLTLPDARFEISQILGWLRVPAVSDKFKLTNDDLEKISRWLQHANVHWGLNAEHKRHWVDGPTTDHFTWKQGLDRLVLGFAYSDETSYVNEQVLLEPVEGHDAVLLGTLVHIIEQLQSARSDLTTPRTPGGWQSYLIEQLRLAILSTATEFERSHQSILKAINDFTEFANRAGLNNAPIPLPVVRHLLENAFASPEHTGSQFMTGQITVCSMVPMRSIPFKVIAILGLNDGEFPRARPPLGFDLMATDSPRLGDRSRRGDDRYLFLEAVLSARQALYLSYQGFDSQKNEPKPPSLVLEELFSYLSQAYGWERTQQIRQLPLQPFSPKNFEGKFPSFEQRWDFSISDEPTLVQLSDLDNNQTWHLNDWVNFFDHPTRVLANTRLNLFHQIHTDDLDDSEPFALNNLDRYQFQDQSIKQALGLAKPQDIFTVNRAASAYPLSTIARDISDEWQAQVESFTDQLNEENITSLTHQSVTVTLGDNTLTAELPFAPAGQDERHVLYWRMANANGKDMIRLWVSHMLANTEQPTLSKGLYRGKDGETQVIECRPMSNARTVLNEWNTVLRSGLKEPYILNATFALSMLAEQWDEVNYWKKWQGDQFRVGLGSDPYVLTFFDEAPEFNTVDALVQRVYGELVAITTLKFWGEEND